MELFYIFIRLIVRGVHLKIVLMNFIEKRKVDKMLNMKKRKGYNRLHIYFMMLIVSLIALSGCSASVGGGISNAGLAKADETYKVLSEEAIQIDDSARESITASNKMGLELIQAMAKLNREKNMLFSPISLSFALAMIENGAEGETKEGILKALGEVEEGINERYNLLMNYLNALNKDESSETPGIKMKVANSLWVRESLDIKKKFVNTLNSFYNAQVFRSNFDDKKTLDQMNQWVEEQTNHMLKETIDEINPETIAYLMNTVYFKGTWIEAFEESATQAEAFFKSETDEIKVDMMYKTDNAPYYEDELCQVTSLPYYGDCSLVLVLPKGDLDNFLGDLTYDDFQKIIDVDKNEWHNLALSLPKFDYEVNNPLNELLSERGMAKSFSEKDAEFGKMIEIENNNVYISSIFQNARIILDEQGTEAAAVTVVEFKCGSAMPSEPVAFNCDKPFLYIIKDDTTGAVLFIGVVREPSKIK